MPRFEEQLGVATGNFISWLIERAVGIARSQPRPELQPPRDRSLPQWAHEVCERAVREGLDPVPERIAEAVKQPALRLCQELILYERYLKRRKRWARKVQEVLSLYVYNLLHDHERRIWLDKELFGGEREGATFTVSLLSLHANIAQAIEVVGRIFVDYCNTETGEPFPRLYDTLQNNVCRVSGVDPQRQAESTKQPVMPREVKGKSPSELLHMYLNGTPFTDFFNVPVTVSLPLSSRFEHTHIVAGSGHGKTQFLQSLILADLDKVREGSRSVIVIDSQGDMFRNILSLAAVGEMAERVVLIDPADIACPPALNLFDFGLDRLSAYNAYDQEMLVNSAIALYEYVFGALLGADLTNRQRVNFRFLARLMMHIPDATIYTLMEFMENPEATRPYLSKLEPTAARFFNTQFFSPTFNDTRQQVLTRLYGVLSHTVLDRMFGHARNKVNLFDAMNRGSLILINTAKDLLKQEGCEILGRFFIALICHAAQERASIDRDKRIPTFVYIDEAHDYFDENMENLLNQARKYQVGLVLSHQNLDQFDTRLRSTVMSSTAIKMVGGLSARDAGVFAHEMQCNPEFLQSMRKQETLTQFACFIRNHTTQPLPLPVRFGQIEQQPKLTAEGIASLKERNRSQVCEAVTSLSRLASGENSRDGQTGFTLGKSERL
jgi:hypothetical protein